MVSQEGKLAAARNAMISVQLSGRGISHAGVLAAFAKVPRQRFVPPDQIDQAYADHPLPIGFGQTISQPYVVALMLGELDPSPEHRVLEIGAGSGYQTALLAEMVAHVYAIERIEQLTEKALGVLGGLNVSNVTLCTGDGSMGWPEEAPFDRIICGAASPDVPSTWVHQLAEGGKIVTPVGGPDVQQLLVAEKIGGDIPDSTRRRFCDVRFVKLIGKHGWAQ